MKTARLAVVAGAALAALTLGSPLAHADDPKFNFGKKEDVKDDVVWKASVQVGAAGAYGNAQTLTVTGGLNISRNDGWNKLTLDAGGLYTQAWVRKPAIADANADGQITREEQTAARESTQAAANWLAKLRYDRFFTERNSGYVSVFAGQDYVAAKSLFTGGQLGYSRLLLKSEMHEMAAEIGYDLSYTRFATGGVDPVLIHSARLFVGYVLTVSKATAVNASVEAFINGNTVKIGPPLDKVNDPNTEKGFGGATRVIGKLGLTTEIYKNINFKFGLTLKFDNAPAPIVELPANTTLAAGAELLRAEKLDLLADAAIQVNFL